MLDMMRDFWDDGYAEYHGRFYDFPLSGMFSLGQQPTAHSRRVTGVNVMPWRRWRQPSAAASCSEKRELMKRFADEVMANV